MQNTSLEEALGLDQRWKPLNSSYTSSASNENGAPEKDLDDLTEEGIKTKEGNKNGE